MNSYAYRLTARKGKRKATKTFRATDDGAAMMQSIGIVMNKALDDELWAQGHIELRELEGGTLINEMPERENV